MEVTKSKKMKILCIVLGFVSIMLILAYVVITPDLEMAQIRYTEYNMGKLLKNIRSCGEMEGYSVINESVLEKCLPNTAILNDGWRKKMNVRCTGGRIEARSAGPDGVFNNRDDIVRIE